MFNFMKEAWMYFLHHPDKTEVIVQVYLLNPFFNCISETSFFIINLIRKVVLKIMPTDKA